MPRLAMLLTLLLVASGAARLAADELYGPPVPVQAEFEIAYAQDPSLHLPALLANWWKVVVAQARLRWRLFGTRTPEVAPVLAQVRSMRVVLSAEAQVERNAYQLPISLWCDAWPYPEAVGRFGLSRSQFLVQDGSRWRIQHQAVPIDIAPPAPGWRLSLRGGLFAGLIQRLCLDQRWAMNGPSQPDKDQLPLGASLSIDGRGVRLQIAMRSWLRPLQPRQLTRVPRGLSAILAVGVDGAGLTGAFDRQELKQMPYGLQYMLEGVLPLPSQLAAIDGTCVIGWWSDGGWSLTLPRSTGLDAQLLDRRPQVAQLKDGEVLEGGGHPLMRTAGSWIISDTASHCRSWLDPQELREVRVPDAQAVLWADAHPDAVAAWIAALPLHALLNLGLPPELARSMQAHLPEEDGVAGLGGHQLLGHMREGGLVVDSQGLILHWLPVLVMLQFVNSSLLEQHSLAQLERLIAQERALRQMVSFADCDPAGLLEMDRGSVRRAEDLIRGPWSVNASGAAWSRYMRSGPSPATVPVSRNRRSEPAMADFLLATSSLLDDQRFPGLQALAHLDLANGSADQLMLLNSEQSNLGAWLFRSGQDLVASGDLRGLILCRRALRLLRHPDCSAWAGSSWWVCQEYGVVLVAACEQGLGEAELEARLHDDAPSEACLWRQWMLNSLGQTVTAILDMSPSRFNYVSYEFLSFGGWPGAQESYLASFGRLLREALLRCEPDPGGSLPCNIPMHDYDTLQFNAPDVEAFRCSRTLLAIAARLLAHAHATSSALPVSQQEAERIAGPLVAPLMSGPAMVAYHPRRDGGFTLQIQVDDVLLCESSQMFWARAPRLPIGQLAPHLALSGTDLLWTPPRTYDPPWNRQEGWLERRARYLLLPAVPEHGR